MHSRTALRLSSSELGDINVHTQKLFDLKVEQLFGY